MENGAPAPVRVPFEKTDWNKDGRRVGSVQHVQVVPQSSMPGPPLVSGHRIEVAMAKASPFMGLASKLMQTPYSFGREDISNHPVLVVSRRSAPKNLDLPHFRALHGTSLHVLQSVFFLEQRNLDTEKSFFFFFFSDLAHGGLSSSSQESRTFIAEVGFFLRFVRGWRVESTVGSQTPGGWTPLS